MSIGDEQSRAIDEALDRLNDAYTAWLVSPDSPEMRARLETEVLQYCEALRPLVADEELTFRWQKAFIEQGEAVSRSNSLNAFLSKRSVGIDDDEAAMVNQLTREANEATTQFEAVNGEVLQRLEARTQALREKGGE